MVPGISAVGEGRGRGLVAELGPVPAMWVVLDRGAWVTEQVLGLFSLGI